MLAEGFLPDACPLCGGAGVPPGDAADSQAGTAGCRIFVLAGQSNMVGRAKARDCPATFSPADPSAHIIWDNNGNFPGGPDFSSSWVALQPQEASEAVTGCASHLHWGPEAMLSVGPQAYFAKFAMGSTKIKQHWDPDTGEHYERFLLFLRKAIAAAPAPAQLAGMFWLQGESDTGAAKTARDYEDDLVRLVARLRSDLGEPCLPFVASQVVWKGKKLAEVNKAIERACAALQPARCVSAEGLTVGDDDHLDRRSVCLVGGRMSEAFAELA